MNLSLDCIPCFVRHALDMARIASTDEAVHEQVLREALLEAAQWDMSMPAPALTQRVALSFVKATRLRAGISRDAETLRKAFPFTDPPYAVALDRGKAVAKFNSGQMESVTYYEALKRLGHLKETPR